MAIALASFARDLAVERWLTEVAAGKPATALDAFAEERADDGPVRVDGRDFAREALEELADCRNYLVWEIQLLRAQRTNSAVIEARLRALGHVAAAWAEIGG